MQTAMRTQIMNDPQTGIPWIEYYQVGGSRPVKMELSQFPFVIGRDESADFTVESTRVSRRHAVLDEQDGAFVLRDLDSTNGTYVNGKRVSEVPVTTGDVVVIADFEFTFFSESSAARASATQVMTQPLSGGGGRRLGPDYSGQAAARSIDPPFDQRAFPADRAVGNGRGVWLRGDARPG
jgi:pSer/pThr/pTyr-binding forkhead associated (FHA) protein